MGLEDQWYLIFITPLPPPAPPPRRNDPPPSLPWVTSIQGGIKEGGGAFHTWADKVQGQQPTGERQRRPREFSKSQTLRVGGSCCSSMIFNVRRGRVSLKIWSTRVPWVTDPWVSCEPGRGDWMWFRAHCTQLTSPSPFLPWCRL